MNFADFPRWLVIMLAVWFGILETARTPPVLLLTIPRFRGELADNQAKLAQPALVEAQAVKAEIDAEAAAVTLADMGTATRLADMFNSLTEIVLKAMARSISPYM